MKSLVKIMILYLVVIVGVPAGAQEAVLKTFTPPNRENTQIVDKKFTPQIQSTKNAPSNIIIENITNSIDPKSNPRTNIQVNIKTNVNSNIIKNINKNIDNTSLYTNSSINEACPTQEEEKPAFRIPKSALAVPVEFIYKENARNINYIDPKTVNTYYPGQRGANQLIIYTPDFGLRTGTNEFGTEAVVVDNIVVQLNGADTLIPTNGFVISGHGSAKKWINENIEIGSKIYIDLQDKKIKSFLTPDSLIFAAKQKIVEANALMEYYRKIDILYDDKKALNFINKSKDLMRKAERNPDNAQIYISEAMEAANNAIKNAIPYKHDELKGVWIRPTQKSPDEIIKTINHIRSVGIDNVFLETYYHGKTIYPSEVQRNYGFTIQREEFSHFDPLRIWVDECRKKDIKLHIWFQSFYIGNLNPTAYPNHILNIRPNWANTTKAGYESKTPVASLSEHNGYFIDPANPEVQEYLLKIISEIIEKYCPDGINLDYIRYPQCIDPKFPNYDMTNWGYTQYARNEFFSQYKVDPVEIKYNTVQWQLWDGYRQNKITKFVKDVKGITKPKQVLLTAVIFPDRKKSLATKMQDWKTWSITNLVDGVTPLILTSDKKTAALLMQDIKANTLPATKVYPGLFVTFMGGSFDDLLMQIQESRKLSTNGVIIFDYAHLEQKYIDALQARVFDSSSVVKGGKQQPQIQYPYDTQSSSKTPKIKKKKPKKGKR